MTSSLRVALLAAMATGVVAPAVHAAPWDKPGYTLTFHDEFDGTTLDTSQWKRRYKWGEAVINGELQAYVDDAFSLQNGILSIVGKKQSGQYAGQTMSYTSGVICSVHEQTYGYFEARLKMPKGKGLWPAFWLLGAVGTSGVNEIDVQEFLGHEPNKIYMTLHWGTDYGSGHQSDGSNYSGPDFSADFHTFGLSWTDSKITWTIDGTERKSYSGPGVPKVPMYVILNLAVGGGWPGAPDNTTTFPADYDVDYVRAYQVGESDAGVGGSAGAGGGAAGSAGSAAGGTAGAAGSGA
ncbi:MAG: glycoside hydrolase family 16 protein, partial [Myxococcales bacterium]|nr:glycoside hydrolase family 16 protein [Myxococcales bacterium]